MTLHLHRATTTDVLADALAELLRTPLPDPFAQELVVVPAKGVERWLSQRLSHRLGPRPGRGDGVCAGVELRSPRSLLAELSGTADDDPWAPDALVWPLLAVIDANAGEPWARVLDRHLGVGRDGDEGDLRRGRRYSVARRLARLFASYAVQRPALLADWEAGRDTDGSGVAIDPDLGWQPELWRRLVADRAMPTPVERHRAQVERIAAAPESVALPDRLSLFGPTRLPSSEIDLLAAVAAHRDVHLWLPHPSPALWESLTELTGVVRRSDDDSHSRAAHPLLATLGRDVRESERALLSCAGVRDHLVAGDRTDRAGLLSWLQSDISANCLPQLGNRQIDGRDHSVRVHACHGPARQVEVLREEILGLLQDDLTLEPRDIVVMCPDIEAYAPLLVAAFGLARSGADGDDGAGHPAHRLQVRLADRSLTQTNPLLGVLGRVLDLAGGRAEASVVLDLLAAAPVRRRFGFSDADLDTIRQWVETAGVRWAFDAEHRAAFGLDGYVQNTWRFGLDRVLAGVAVSDDAGRYFDKTLPLDDVGSTSIDLAGRLAECVDRLQRLTDKLAEARPASAWLTVLGDVVEQLCEAAYGDEWQVAQVHRELSGLAGDPQATSAADVELRLPDIRALLSERLSGRPTRANFRTGSLTVATLVPMRSVPHRVICLLGIDDGAFPRSSTVDGDDVLARRPLTGERDPRSEDRQLLLDAVMAARDHLVITYSGADEITGRARPPAVPLGELLDALDATAEGGSAHALVTHPLQAFDERNFVAGAPASFDRAAYAGALAVRRKRPRDPGIDEVRCPPSDDDVGLDDLLRFFRHPVREFLTRRLEIALPDDGDDIADGIPVELDGLARWGVGDRMLGDLLRGHDSAAALAREWRRGVLPPGRLGWRQAQQIAGDAVPIAEAAAAARSGLPPHAVDVDVDLGGGRRLQGTVADLYGDRVVQVSFSRLGPRHHLDAWIRLLALCAARPGRPWSAGAFTKDRRIVFAAVDDALPLLRDLVGVRDAGLCGAIPLPPKTSLAYASMRNPQAGMGKARIAWEKKLGPEWEDAAHVRVWGEHYPFDDLVASAPLPGEEYDGETSRFGALARRVWQPVMEHRL